MIDYILTSLVPLFMAITLIGGGKSLKNSNIRFFDRDYTTALKGLAAIVVIMVHIRPEHGNALQDAIGSFAYIGVTFFFLVSAYGMQMAVERKENYLKNFWRNRLVSLLVPMLLINIMSVTFYAVCTNTYNWSSLWNLNGYVKVLLTYCLWFWLVMMVGKRFNLKKNVTDCMLIGGVVVSSLLLYFLVNGDISAESGWCFERMGLVWGLLLYRYFPDFVKWMEKDRNRKMAVTLICGVILGVAYLKFKTVWFTGEYLLKVVLGFVLLTCLFVWTCKMNLGNKLSLWLGDISYEIYLVHGFAMGVIGHYLQVSSGVFVVLTVALSIVLAYIIHSLSKPIVKYLRS